MKMARLEIFLFGGFHVRYAGETVTHFESDKVRALLASAPDSRSTTSPRVAGGFAVSDRSELSARTNLRIALSSLRNAIHEQTESPHFLQADRQTILWKRSSDYWLDVEAFAQRIAALRQLHPLRIRSAPRSISTRRFLARVFAGGLQRIRGLDHSRARQMARASAASRVCASPKLWRQRMHRRQPSDICGAAWRSHPGMRRATTD